MSPIRTSRAGLAGSPLDWIRPSSQALAASARVLKNLADQSHLSIRTELIPSFSYKRAASGDFSGQSPSPNLWRGADNFSVAGELRQHRGKGKKPQVSCMAGRYTSARDSVSLE